MAKSGDLYPVWFDWAEAGILFLSGEFFLLPVSSFSIDGPSVAMVKSEMVIDAKSIVNYRKSMKIRMSVDEKQTWLSAEDTN